MKACRCNLINFSKFRDAFIMKEEKHTYSSQWEKKLRKVGLSFKTGCFIKAFNMVINQFFYLTSSFAVQFSLFVIRMTQGI